MHELFPKRSSHAGLIKGLADQGLGGQPVRYNRKLSTALDTVKVVNLPTISLEQFPLADSRMALRFYRKPFLFSV